VRKWVNSKFPVGTVLLMNFRFLVGCSIIGIANASMAQTPGRLVYTQLGVSSSAATETLSANGNTIQILQVSKTGSGQTPASLMFLPNGTSGIVHSGNASSECSLTRSQSGRFMYFPGYAGTISTTRSGGGADTVNRIACRLDFTGAYNIETRLSDAHSANNFRSVVLSETPISNNYKLWTAGANEGIRTANLIGTTSSLISTTNTNNRLIDIVSGDLILSTSSTIRRIAGTPTSSGNAMTTLLTTNSGQTIVHSSVYGFCFIGNTATGGSLSLYLADDAAGVIKYTSTNGLAGPFTQAYRLTTTTMRSLCTDGKVLYGVTCNSTSTRNNNQIQIIYDGGAGSSFTQALFSAVGTGNSVGAVALAPEPIVVDSDYTTGGSGESPIPGNIMTLRSGNNAQRTLKVGLVPDSGHRTWTSLATVNYDGQAVKTAVDSSGNTYILIQSETNGGSSTVVPTVQISKVPVGGGSASSSSVVNLAAGDEAFAITVDSSNRPVIAYRPSSGAQTVKFVRWNSDLTTDASYTNSGSGFSSGSKTPIDIAYNPNSGKYLTTLFATGNTMSTTDFSSTFSNSSPTSDLALSADLNSVAVTPLSIQFGSDNLLRVLSVGSTTATRALLRVDTLASSMATVDTAGTNYRRDATGTPLVLNGAAAKASATTAYLWALGLSMKGDLPCVLMTGIGESTTGPSGVGNGSTENIIGSGKIWTMTSSNAIGSGSKATASFAPGFSPVN